jgi:hypothetical protein
MRLDSVNEFSFRERVAIFQQQPFRDRTNSTAFIDLINRKIKNKICGADDLERLGSGVTVWQMAYLSAAVVRP